MAYMVYMVYMVYTVWILHFQTPTPARPGAEAIANADCRGVGGVADAFVGAILADSTHTVEGAV
jgi:hypothetical protein